MNVKFVDRKEEQPRNVHFYAEKKVAKLDRFFRSDAEATITFTPQKKGMVKAEVAVNAGGALYRGESTTSDANASVDAAIAAMSIVSRVMNFLFCIGLGFYIGYKMDAGEDLVDLLDNLLPPYHK